MIKRNIPKSIAPAETLQQYSFTANGSINVTTAPTVRETIYDATNMQVNLDGSLSIRKPLVLKRTHITDMIWQGLDFKSICVGYIFNGTTPINIMYDSLNKKVYFLVGSSMLRMYDVDDNLLQESTPIFDAICDNVGFINTANSTILYGIRINLSKLADGKYNSNLIPTDSDNYQYRYLKIVKVESGGYKIIFIQPDTPAVEISEEIAINYNTISDYVYGVSDNYQAQAFSVSAILPYVPKDKKRTDLSTVTIEELTESENFVTFSSIAETNAYSPYILKAFLNLKSDVLENCYCTWEKTYDGITWASVPEFINNFETTPIKVKDNSVSYESLTETYVNTRTVLFCKLSNFAYSKTDLLTARPDVLILDKMDSATYRFKIVLVRTETFESATGIVFKSFESGSLPINTSTTSGVITSTFKFSLDSTKTYVPEKIKVVQKNINTLDNTNLRTHGVSVGTFAYESILSVEDNETILTVTVKFNDVSLLSGFTMQAIFATYAITYAGTLIHVEHAKHLLYYTKEHVDSLETVSLNDIEQDYTATVEIDPDAESQHTQAPAIEVFITPEVGKFEGLIKQYTNTSTNPYKFSLESVVLKNIYSKIMSEIRAKLYELSLNNYIKYSEAYIDDGRFGLPEGTYGLYYYEGDVHIYYGEFASKPVYEFSYVPLDNDWNNSFILDWQDNDTVPYNSCFLKVPTYFDYKHTAKSYLDNVENNLDTGNFILAWQGPKNYNYIYFRNPNTRHSDSEYYFTEIVKRVLEARTVLELTNKTHSETKGLGALTEINYKLNTGAVKPVALYPNIYDGVIDTVIYTDEFESVSVEDEEPSLLDSATLTIGQANWAMLKSNNTELLNVKIPNTVGGNKLYYNHRIFTYGKDYKNCIYVTDVDSFTTPLFNMIDLNASEDSVVTALVPWRDYLIAATESSIYLIRETEAGFTSKVINTYIGIPEKDSKTCKSILNGLVFKSGTKIYSLQPSMYSSDDSILNIAEISKNVANYVVDGDATNFAITTEQAYYVFIPSETTLCLRYEFSRKLWTKFVYPKHLVDYHLTSVEDISVFSNENQEFFFEQEYEFLLEYGDVLSFTKDDDEIVPVVTPIEFMFDSGQKTNDLSRTKQFVESKLLFATINEKEALPLNVVVTTDGLDKRLHFDVSNFNLNTDGVFWKDGPEDILTLGTNVGSENQNAFNVIRQMFIRYSGRGKSIRHIVYGKSCFNFKFFVVYYKYKNLHVKQ